MVAAQQSAPAVSRACSTGLQKLLQQQSAVSGTLQHACRCLSGQADTAQQQRRQQAAAAAALTSSTSRSKLSYISPKKRGGYRARLPRVRKYGAELQDKDPAAFDRMRLVLGYYDLPQNRHKPRPLPPSHVTINNLQTIMFTKDVDPYYKLALLNYRSKLVNMKLLPGVFKIQNFLQQLSAPPDIMPAHLEEALLGVKTAATAAAEPENTAAEPAMQQQQLQR
eukprot:GHRR01006555.1.p1 GENE.GHRR01006555.1~~GHRR01006555.1.p1  ORF type:complete len:223 (+),score=104.08 GHRR01006555.1:192-860(+)